MGNYRMCACFIRRFKVLEAAPPPDVREAFNDYAKGAPIMTAEQLRRFLLEMQGDAGTDAERIVEQILRKRHHVTKFARNGLSLDDFYFYLFSADLNPPLHNQVHHDMTKPLCHYFIYTGHNSYLTGNQLNSDCSDSPIMKALKRGVRVIELDLWPNSDEVHVKHGRTLTTPVELLTCLKTIDQYAFSSSPYPVIITLEDHLTPELQAKVAQMITETFGNKLYRPECECLKDLPSPEDLKYRIIISTKPPKEYKKAEGAKGKGSKSEKDSDVDSWEKDPEPLDITGDQYIDNLSSSDTHEESDEEPRESQYKRLITIHAGKPKGGLKEALKVEPNRVRRLSLNELALEKATEHHGKDVIKFTRKNLLRVYPKGIRFDSSNYKPQLGWMHGAQMVAFNMQGYGRSLWLMHGMFRANGSCGYVRKPDFLMNDETYNPKDNFPVRTTLKVKVYMGDGWNLDFKRTHFDLCSPPDFYAKVAIAGVGGDVKKMKTRVIEDNWTPVWDEEFTFPLSVPELALLRIEVHEYDITDSDDFGGQTCLPVSELRQGIRAVPLFSRKGEKYNSVRLLMRFLFV
ncbi:hypothetical protein K2173_007672 [Erythroxylum novogranatense]|uniref:Phosphoinositide phospholipase C n=1 Tax=Erythroxylum novogranatense TaxID=1862640 RepID=A0AAV8TS84_9ROSI|nr:hypothetical protein K2173_007672 [Erythroxylum novogranatense]